ncbi:DUF2306 domain-containing protein [Paenibacillus abyssi]|uniref:DUF2306 domain-containing protein n=1 Tax=Paenibacillus abyssi TaxID=1340531 RepID=A0A917FYE1_9BACL|nr:DUF2306 domain-containing protein [Paenibacillus abyssi]GGG14064.1 DUF2306 domain-containing protein [Paenibacillus abyssi]
MKDTIDMIMLIMHIISGYLALGIGIAAMLAPKKRGRHTTSGSIYFWLVTVVCASAIVMSIMNWEVSSYLFYVAIFSYVFALFGYIAYKMKWKNWMVSHIAGMGGSYIAIVTGFIVVNQSNAPFLAEVPSLVLWLLPTIVGTPILRMVGNKYDTRMKKRHP